MIQNKYNSIVDLSRVLNNETAIYPGTVRPKIKQSNTISNDGFAEKELNICSHFGTHIDAPSHMIQAAMNLDDFKIDKFIGRAVLIDVQNQSKIGINLLNSFPDLENFDFIIFRTGWEKYWNENKYFSDYPILTEEAAEFIGNFKLKGIGIDAISPDPVGDTEMKIHKILLRNNVLIIENLCNLDQLKSNKFTFQCFPLKIENADGSPVRAIAIFN